MSNPKRTTLIAPEAKITNKAAARITSMMEKLLFLHLKLKEYYQFCQKNLKWT